MVLLYRVLDLSAMNAYILYNMHQPKVVERGAFLKKTSMCACSASCAKTCYKYTFAKRTEVYYELRFR